MNRLWTLWQLARGVVFPSTFQMWLNTGRKLTVYNKKEEEEALGPDKFLNERISYLCKPFTRNRPNSVPDCSTLFTSSYKYLHSFITRMAETCAVPLVPCKRKADPCKFLSVQILCGPVLYGVLVCFTFNVDGSD